MVELSPMSEDEMRAEIAYIKANYYGRDGWQETQFARTVLAYAHAKAEAERLEFHGEHQLHKESFTDDVFCVICDKSFDKRHVWTEADWLNAVLQRLRWREDK